MAKGNKAGTTPDYNCDLKNSGFKAASKCIYLLMSLVLLFLPYPSSLPV